MRRGDVFGGTEQQPYGQQTHDRSHDDHDEDDGPSEIVRLGRTLDIP